MHNLITECRTPSLLFRPLRTQHLRLCKGGKQRSICNAAAAAPSSTALTLNVEQTSIDLPMKLETGKRLQSSVQDLLTTFAAKQKAERPQRWKSMEFKVKGDPELQEVELFEVFCNPNAAATAFDARVLITLKTKEGVKVTTEGRLSSFKADVDSFIDQNG